MHFPQTAMLKQQLKLTSPRFFVHREPPSQPLVVLSHIAPSLLLTSSRLFAHPRVCRSSTICLPIFLLSSRSFSHWHAHQVQVVVFASPHFLSLPLCLSTSIGTDDRFHAHPYKIVNCRCPLTLLLPYSLFPPRRRRCPLPRCIAQGREREGGSCPFRHFERVTSFSPPVSSFTFLFFDFALLCFHRRCGILSAPNASYLKITFLMKRRVICTWEWVRARERECENDRM